MSTEGGFKYSPMGTGLVCMLFCGIFNLLCSLKRPFTDAGRVIV